MEYSDAGYLRPVISGNVASQADDIIAELCPGDQLDLSIMGGQSHLLWGPLVGCRSGHASDPALRHHASSGGVLSALLQHILATGAVDRIIQVGPSDEDPTQNRSEVSRAAKDVWKSAGSRYAPSSPLENLMQELERPGRFAVVGKPCDIAAVRKLLSRDERALEKIPYLFSFFCAGIPSIKGANQIVEKLGFQKKDLKEFRYRGDGWPGFATAIGKNNDMRRMSYSESWGDILSHHVQFRCKICPDGSGGFADVVCGDAWESDERGYPRFMERDGQSIVLSRTQRGEDLVTSAIKAGVIEAGPLSIDQIIKMQPSQARRRKLVMSRLWAIRGSGRSPPAFKGFRLREAAWTAGIKENIKSFLGLLRRLYLRKAGE
jgi:coenzyme F420 hydrogenase subunit beta